jgi:hypothetical protein
MSHHMMQKSARPVPQGTLHISHSPSLPMSCTPSGPQVTRATRSLADVSFDVAQPRSLHGINASSSHPFGHGEEAPLAPSPSGRGRGVKVAALPAPTQWRRGVPMAHGQKPLTLTLSQWERG